MNLKNEIGWSVSRVNLLKECKRKYYYTYYGAWGGWESNASPDQKELYLLKNLTDLHNLLGDKVHKTIVNVLNQLHHNDHVSVQSATEFFLKSFNKSIELSEKFLYRNYPKMGGLIQHEYSLPLEEEKIEEVRKQGKTCVENFMISDMLKEIKESDRSGWIFCKDFNSYELNGMKVWAVFDFAYIKDGNLHIIDFKSGKGRESEKNDQSLSYALYFLRNRGIELEKIKFIFHHLYSDKADPIKFSAEDIKHIEEKIAKDYDTMKSLLKDQANNVAEVSSFPKTENIQLCNFCKFRRYCNPRE